MSWKKVDIKLVGSLSKQDIFNNGELIIKKGDILTNNTIDLLTKHKIEKVSVKKIKLDDELAFQIESIILKSSQPLFWEEYSNTILATKVYFTLIENDCLEPPEPLLFKVHDLIGLLENKKEFFELAYSIRGYSDSLFRHTINVSILAYMVGELETVIDNPILLCQMGYLHDIGKSKINQEILYKATPLTEAEKALIQSHTVLGVELLRKLGIYRKEILDSVLWHHESRKGTGYPNRLSKDEIPFSVQIITTVDAFDVICSDRIYKEGDTFFEALNKLYFDAVNGTLNPVITFSFIEHIFKLYLDEKIVLSDGSTGKIYYLNPKEIIRPIIILDDDTFLDLSRNRDIYIVDFI